MLPLEPILGQRTSGYADAFAGRGQPAAALITGKPALASAGLHRQA